MTPQLPTPAAIPAPASAPPPPAAPATPGAALGQLRFPAVPDWARSPWARIGLGAAAFVTAGLTASSDDGIVLCPFRRCTGGYCPGCGMTRSAGKLIRGDVLGSWHHHPFLMLGLVQAVVVGSLWATGSRWWHEIERHQAWLLGANAALLAGIWLARMGSGDIPVPFGS